MAEGSGEEGKRDKIQCVLAAQRVTDALNDASVLNLALGDQENLHSLITDFFGEDIVDEDDSDSEEEVLEDMDISDSELSVSLPNDELNNDNESVDINDPPTVSVPDTTPAVHVAVLTDNPDDADEPAVVVDQAEGLIQEEGIFEFVSPVTEEELNKIENFNRCTCKKGNCLRMFKPEYIMNLRMQMVDASMTDGEKKMYLLGKLSTPSNMERTPCVRRGRSKRNTGVHGASISSKGGKSAVRPSCLCTGRSGVASVEDLALTPCMLDHIQICPIQWEVTLNGNPTNHDEPMNLALNTPLQLSVTIVNKMDEDIGPLFLDVQPYLDHQNGTRETNLGNRVVCAGCCHRTISQLKSDGEFQFQLSCLFLYPGLYKFNITCRERSSHLESEVPTPHESPRFSRACRASLPIIVHEDTMVTEKREAKMWKYRPAVEVLVKE